MIILVITIVITTIITIKKITTIVVMIILLTHCRAVSGTLRTLVDPLPLMYIYTV